MIDLPRIQQIFESCIQEAGIFTRDGGPIVEGETVTLANGKWLVLGAGLSPNEASNYFKVTSKRAERSRVQFSVAGTGRGSMLFVIRPTDVFHQDGKFIAPFNPRDKLPFVEIKTAYLRLWEVPLNDCNVKSLRWELDAESYYKKPFEKWLHSWHGLVGFNPAHAPSHVHINSEPLCDAAGNDLEVPEGIVELRLATGVPNPLALILSIASWVRQGA